MIGKKNKFYVNNRKITQPKDPDSKDLKSQKLVNNKLTTIERSNLVRRINSARRITVES
ncbi:hypothetical protein Hanom_Chr07g00602361 [Helianthus anomalus]